MARHKDTEWCLPEGKKLPEGGSTHCWESIHASVLMDIRDELKHLNSLLWCQNFTGIPRTLRQIQINTRKRPLKKK